MATRYLCPVFLAIAFWLPSAQGAVVPNVVGQTQAAATRTLANARLAVGSVTTSPCVPAGQVISQSPAAGTSVGDGAWVDLVVCAGAATGSSPTPGPVRPPPTPASGAVRVSIRNVYELSLNFGPLGEGRRAGTDEAEGVLEKRGAEYVGTMTARVRSGQSMAGLMGTGCGGGQYDDSQELSVVGRPVSGFNARSQTITFTGTNYSPTAGNEYLALTFKPNTSPSLRGATQNDSGDTVINCHTLIPTPSGIAFLPLNDARWTLPHSGYIIALPPDGAYNYTDTTVSGATGTTLSPVFNVSKSIWTIRVERL